MSKVISVNFAEEEFEYIDVRISPYVGFDNYERWPTRDEIIAIGRKLANRIIQVRQKMAHNWKLLHDMSFDVEEITGIPQLELWDQDFKRLSDAAYKRKWASECVRLAVVPDIPRENYTVDPFVGWTCLVEANYTGNQEVDQLIDKYRYDIIWNRGVCSR